VGGQVSGSVGTRRVGSACGQRRRPVIWSADSPGSWSSGCRPRRAGPGHPAARLRWRWWPASWRSGHVLCPRAGGDAVRCDGPARVIPARTLPPVTGARRARGLR